MTTNKTENMVEYRKQYYEDNKNKFKDYMTERYTCKVCNCTVAKCRRTVHEKTKKHKRNLQDDTAKSTLSSENILANKIKQLEEKLETLLK